MTVKLYTGDCLKVLARLPAGSIDAVVTDPPYMIGAVSVGSSRAKSGTWADMANAAFWFAEWYGESWRVLKPTGFLATFCNWRSLPTVLCAMSQRNIAATNCLVWDKEWIGPCFKNALRPVHELVILAAKPRAVIADRRASDIFRCKWMAGHSKTSTHPAEKPVPLVEFLIKHLSPTGETVLDPFMGSGTTGVACKQLGRNFIGIEIDPSYVRIARKRIAACSPSATSSPSVAHKSTSTAGATIRTSSARPACRASGPSGVPSVST